MIQTFNFNEEDLQANRTGVLSDEQSQRFTYEANTWAKAGRLAGLYLLIGTLLLLIAGHPQSTFDRVSSFLVTAGIIGVPAFFAWRLKRDVNNKTVLSVTGIVTANYSSRGSTIIVCTGNSQQRFLVQSYRRGTLQPEAVYTLYYLPITRRIIAAE